MAALKEGHRIAHSRLSDLEMKSKEAMKATENLEARFLKAFENAETAHHDLQKKTSDAFDKAHSEYAKERSVQDRIKVIEHRISEMDNLVRSLRGPMPQAQPTTSAEAR